MAACSPSTVMMMMSLPGESPYSRMASMAPSVMPSLWE